MNIIVVTQPLFEPVSDAEVFSHLRLDVGPNEALSDHPDYALVMGQVKAAREKAEQITRRAFVRQTLRLVMGGVRSGIPGAEVVCSRAPVELLRPPVASVSSVKYYDEDNVLQTISAADYFVTDDMVPRLTFVDGFSVPCTYGRSDAFRVEYVAGYAPTVASPTTQAEYAGGVPAGIKYAILMGVQLLYDELTPEKREALEKTRDSLLESLRVHTF